MYFAFNPSSYAKRLYIAGEEVSHLVIPPTVSIINRDAFWNSQSLISVEIPDTVTEIGMRAFFYCVNLKEIRIPDSVKK
ncbi:MAG: leucine-rich repeat protein [Bacteroides sp.]|nr:leucine-rich repeat protein [Bacteroides sp.]